MILCEMNSATISLWLVPPGASSGFPIVRGFCQCPSVRQQVVQQGHQGQQEQQRRQRHRCQETDVQEACGAGRAAPLA
jgi:hypothetical protein